MIKYHYESGQYCPQVFCDWCGQRIEKAIDGNVEWDPKANKMLPYFTHKRCCFQWESANGGRAKWYCDELKAFPLFLGVNLDMERKVKIDGLFHEVTIKGRVLTI